ncbi:hypothetical protein GLAREA_00609 [Glarea lozoyensis ATCC 20868]|uniref:Uncharacterized protein n=1 Tax=Glarea lozoyensis (strain ATCC 20868 / MF5171) TaxID=1116229 RepID=S3CWX4_GLAL2|nr:uncharacterized protein GLAREA_00609 [Glarea lozoyensis ATCC 20868]EPE29449.1 hypothetical protein GLAREA_00609 [Glarea lozoyensis ATCC 20868]
MSCFPLLSYQTCIDSQVYFQFYNNARAIPPADMKTRYPTSEPAMLISLLAALAWIGFAVELAAAPEDVAFAGLLVVVLEVVETLMVEETAVTIAVVEAFAAFEEEMLVLRDEEEARVEEEETDATDTDEALLDEEDRAVVVEAARVDDFDMLASAQAKTGFRRGRSTYRGALTCSNSGYANNEER